MSASRNLNNEPKQKRDSKLAIENYDDTVSLLTYDSDDETIPNPPNSPTKNQSDNASILKRSNKLIRPSFFGSYQQVPEATSSGQDKKITSGLK